ncbi:MAG: sulfate adenylyltransferase subunit CysD [Candidatus Omnitrophica bacterium]|nr:sulfate adenylyltransferase subunit CysD [Candidatus Omnitrophota bacterium]MCM8798720.1 sulfate adenylyltransferase subunit CysD [Candidatus Omnitrophota bacterium]
MDYIEELENKSIYIIREAYQRFKHIALLWSIGKDSTTLVWLVRKSFLGEIPFPVIHIDTGFKFKEIYAFREEFVRKWKLKLLVSKNEPALAQGMGPEKGKFACCNALKTEALKATIREHNFKALLLAIRRDEHGLRAKERYYSPRDADFRWDYQHQPPELWNFYKSKIEEEEHFRIHPLLHWREIDIWRYIQREKIPVVSLYFAKDSKRYRSIGCAPCCNPIDSNADNIKKIIKELKETKIAERIGRAQDKEDTYTMQKLRSLGYM